MTTGLKNQTAFAELLETQGACTAPLDAAVEYIRMRIGRVLPLYVVAMLPFSIVMVLLIDAINSEQRSFAAECCVYLVAATVWRWIWLARLQQQVQEDLQARRGAGFWSRIGQILLLRLLGNGAITWGGFLAGVPAFYGLFVGSFATPLLLENTDPTFTRLKHVLSWIHHSAWRLGKIGFAITVVAALLTVAILVNQYILGQVILPTILGMDTADLNLTIQGWAWRLSVFYFVFLLIDAFWTVAAVILYYDSQSRRMATDLSIRLHNITEAPP
jgi:hypothetical protein